MFRMFRRRVHTDAALALYRTLVEKAREPAFYAELVVPDTVDGRFDLIVIHAMLVLRRLRNGGYAAETVGQALFDLMFKDMDQSLRELGVGDMSVGKHIKRMAKAFYGRASAYEIALETTAASGQWNALEQGLRENLYRHGEPAADRLRAMADYVVRADRHVKAQDVARLSQGQVDFALPVAPCTMETARAATAGT